MLCKYHIGKSAIHGKGVIASRNIHKGEVVGEAIAWELMGWHVTDMGGFVNHSLKSNSRLVQDGLAYNLVATQAIGKGEEIAANYNETPQFVERPHADWQ